MWLVDLAADGSVAAERIDCPVPRPLARLRGTLAELLADPRHTPHEQSWVQATLTDPARPAQPMDELRRRFPHALQLLFEPEGGDADGALSYAARVSGRSDLEVAEGFVRHVRPGRSVDAAEHAWLVEGLESVRRSTERAQEETR